MTAPRPKYEALKGISGWLIVRDGRATVAFSLTEAEARRWAASAETLDMLKDDLAIVKSLEADSILNSLGQKLYRQWIVRLEAAIRRAEPPGGE